MIGLHLLFFFLLLFPLTGSVEGTTLMPRPNLFSLDPIRTIVQPQDVLAYQGGFSLEFPLLSCAQSTGILTGGANRDMAISKQQEVDLFNSSQAMHDLLTFKGVTKLVIPLEIVQVNGKIHIQKIQHLLTWYGNPAVISAAFHLYDHGQLLRDIPYPLLVFQAHPSPPTYTLTTLTPIHLRITNTHHLDHFMINIQYNSWWYASAEGTKTPIINRGGYITFTNVQNIPVIDLHFSMFWFYLGRLISLIALLFVCIFYRTYSHIPNTFRLDLWKHYLRSLPVLYKRPK